MNFEKIAMLLRELADEFEHQGASKTSTKTKPSVKHEDKDTLRSFLPVANQGPFENLSMPFGKYKGMNLLNVPISYFKFLGNNNFTSSGNPVGDAIELAIQYIKGEITLADDDPPISDTYSETGNPDDFDELDDDVPF